MTDTAKVEMPSGDPLPHSAWAAVMRELLGLAPLDGAVAVTAAPQRVQDSQADPGVELARTDAARKALTAKLRRLEQQTVGLGTLSPEQAGRLDTAAAKVRAALTQGDLALAQDLLVLCEEAHVQAAAELAAARDGVAVDQAYAAAMRQGLTREWTSLNSASAGLTGAEVAERAALKLLSEPIPALIEGGQFDLARQQLKAWQEALDEAAEAIAERQRRREVLAMLERRLEQETQYSIAVAHAERDLRGPSPALNQREQDYYTERLAAKALVETAKALGPTTPKGGFDAAVAAALARIKLLHQTCSTHLAQVDSERCKTKSKALTPRISASFKDLPKGELPLLRARMKGHSERAQAWEAKQQPAQQMVELNSIDEGMTLTEAYLKAKATLSVDYEALCKPDTSLEPNCLLLTAAHAKALAEADANLSNLLAADDVFDDLLALMTQVQDFNRDRLKLEQQATALKERWKTIKPRADQSAVFALDAKLEALCQVDGLDFDTLPTRLLDATTLGLSIDAAVDLLKRYDAAHAQWLELGKICTGALLPFGKTLGSWLTGLASAVKTDGYAQTLLALKPEALPKAKIDLTELAKTLLAVAAAAPAKDQELVKFQKDRVTDLLALLDAADPATLAQACKTADGLLKVLKAAKPLIELAAQLEKQILPLKQGLSASFPAELNRLLSSALDKKTTDGAEGERLLTAELSPLLAAAQRFKKARDEVGAGYNAKLKAIDKVQQNLITKQRSTIEAQAAAATTPGALDQASADLRALCMVLLPKVHAYCAARGETEALLLSLVGLGAPAQRDADALADAGLRRELDELHASLASSMEASDYEAATGKLGLLKSRLTALKLERRNASRAQLKSQLGDASELAGLVDSLCALPAAKLVQGPNPNGAECFDAMYKTLGADEMAEVIKSLHASKQSGPQPPAKEATASALLQLGRELDPAVLKKLINDGCGGASAMVMLLEQGFGGRAGELAELSKAYPDITQLKLLIDEGFGDIAKMSQVVRLGCGSAKQLKALDAAFAEGELKTLLDEGFGDDAEAMGTVLGKGCKRDPAKLKDLSAKLPKDQLLELLNTGCGDAATLANLLGEGCAGDAAKLKQLNDAFAAGDLAELNTLLTSLGGAASGPKVKALAEQHYANDLSKLKTELYDKIEAGFPGDAATLQKMLAAAPEFKCGSAKAKVFNVPFDPAKFNNVRVEHFLERHCPALFDFGDKDDGTSKIDASNTQWPADFTPADLERALKTTMNQTQNDPAFATLAVGQTKKVTVDLPEYGVKVKIGYKKYEPGTIVVVDQFFPTGSTGIPGTKKTVTPQQFSGDELKALKRALGQ